MAFRVPNTQDPHADFSNKDLMILVRRGKQLQAQAMREFLASPFRYLREALDSTRFERDDHLDTTHEAPARP